jgi:hypothetical protein
MTDNKQLQQAHDASWEAIDSLRETSQTVADSLVAIQDRNLKFTQNIFLSWMELITGQTESIQHLQQQWGQQAQAQRDAFQKLASSSTQMYLDFLLAPFSYSRRLIDVTEGTIQQEQEAARKAARTDHGKG